MIIIKPKRPKLKKGQEWVWDYPRPPRLELFKGNIEIMFSGEHIVTADEAWRVLETSHPPVYYISPEYIMMRYLRVSGHVSYCEWKGSAHYFDIIAGNKKISNAAWTYPNPTPEFTAIRNQIAFYAHQMDVCRINNEVVQPQPGKFYGGWITSGIVGPFKGGPGSMGW